MSVRSQTLEEKREGSFKERIEGGNDRDKNLIKNRDGQRISEFDILS